MLHNKNIFLKKWRKYLFEDRKAESTTNWPSIIVLKGVHQVEGVNNTRWKPEATQTKVRHQKMANYLGEYKVVALPLVLFKR